MNSTHNVSPSTSLALLTELEKAKIITQELVDGSKKNISWKRLFKKFNFFKAYTHFIQIWVLSKNEEVYKKWLGWVESKLRKLITWLERLN